MAQPVHSPLSLKEAVKYPLEFNLSDKVITFLGQNQIQISHPLQRSWSISIYPFIQTSTPEAVIVMIRTPGTSLEVSIPPSEPQLSTDNDNTKTSQGQTSVSPGSMGNRFGLGVICGSAHYRQALPRKGRRGSVLLT